MSSLAVKAEKLRTFLAGAKPNRLGEVELHADIVSDLNWCFCFPEALQQQHDVGLDPEVDPEPGAAVPQVRLGRAEPKHDRG